MNFSGLSPEQRVRILMELRGATQFITQMNQSAAATARMAREEAVLAKATRGANAMSFVQRQGLYTLRRYTFYATLGITGLAFAVAKLGLNYYNTTKTAGVAFNTILHNQKAVSRELDILYGQAAASPFTYTEIVKAARLILPYAGTLAITNRTVQDLSNTLSAAGQITGGSMQRAALQMSHMFTIGRLTGQTLLALSRDFVPMNKALQMYLHLSGEQVRQQVAAGLISASIAAKALHRYLHLTGQDQAALNQSTKTLVGAWSTLKDLLGMSASSAEGGIFERLRKSIRGIDIALLKMTNAGRHITMMDFMTALDKQFSPRTHFIINTFILLTTTLKTIAAEFYVLYYAVITFFRPFDWLGNKIGLNRAAMKLFGFVLGTYITLITIAKARTLLFAEAEVVATAVTVSWGKGIIFLNGALRIMNLMIAGELLATLGKWAFANKQAGHAGAKLGERVFINTGLGAKLSRVYLTKLAPALTLATKSMWRFIAANIALIGFWGAIIIILVVLYFKWGAFHRSVDNLWKNIIYYSPIVAAALVVAFGPIGAAITGLLLVIRYWQQLKALLHPVDTPRFDENAKPGQAFKQWYTPPPRLQKAFHWVGKHLADGGTTTSAGSVMVGERGPEILHLPRAASVVPLDNTSLHNSVSIIVRAGPVYLEGRKVGTVMAEVVTDKAART